MDGLELFRTAIDAIKTNKTRSLLTALGIIIGVASVILLVSIGSGLQSFITGEFESLGSNTVFIAPGRMSGFGGGPPGSIASKFTWNDITNLGRLGEPVTKASGFITKPTLAKYQNRTVTAAITGIDENYLPDRKLKLATGKFFSKSSLERSQLVAVIGWHVYEELFKTREALNRDIDVGGQKVKVIGILVKRGGGFSGAQDENSMVFMPVTAAIKITGIKTPATILVKTTDAAGTTIAVQKINNYFYRRNLTDDDFTVMEPTELLSTINSFLGAITGALTGIAAISLVVGGIGIANIMLVSVTERTREIGLRKAVGATSRNIMTQFLTEAVVLSLVGGGIGITIGWGGSLIIRQFIETAVTWQSVALAFGVSAAVGIVSGIVPAIRAARLNPIDALRYE
ncbi:MAG: ABC transporter permease [bacterium]|nr:ABC transporter permease [bacterium]